MNETQEIVLGTIAVFQGTATPQRVAEHLTVPGSVHFSTQAVARSAIELERQGLIVIHRRPKMTWYETTPEGAKAAHHAIS